jgi:hypothetical protein
MGMKTHNEQMRSQLGQQLRLEVKGGPSCCQFLVDDNDSDDGGE